MSDSVFSKLKIYDYKQAFNNAIRKGMKNPEDYMYMYSTFFKDYFKHSVTRNYRSYFNYKNISTNLRKFTSGLCITRRRSH